MYNRDHLGELHHVMVWAIICINKKHHEQTVTLTVFESVHMQRGTVFLLFWFCSNAVYYCLNTVFLQLVKVFFFLILFALLFRILFYYCSENLKILF